MKIAFVLPEIGPGGAERVATLLAGAWADSGHAVTLLTLDDGSRPPFHNVPPLAVHRPLGLQGESRGTFDAISANFKRVRTLRAALRALAPDVVVSFIDQANVLTLLATRGTAIPVVASERVAPTLQPLSRHWRLLRRLTYPFAARLVAPTRAMAAMMQPWSRLPVAVIANPVVAPTHPKAERGNSILAVGRLVPQKGFDRLIKAGLPQGWTLCIAGEGPERPRLEALAQASPQIQLPGVVADLAPLYASCGLFVLSSRFEGFPNALAEAMAAGCPCVAVDCPTGPAEMIEDGVNGILVAPEDLGAAIARLAGDATLRIRLGENAATYGQHHSPQQIAASWLALLDCVMVPPP
ncbi:glycosyltransferase family 4 protein [uncultured Magnetospirillum sp.]|uniref:glycosyltransferase family 4 protein n=1 Tax=uncultured Magnetospirillum sp. TaxID=354119 RepID=UPI00092B0DFF|nr:glycosyltransferase family 4 protein [uncultured Magnetospirillum sp.]OJX75947.1 MAG: hypothetical protein BGO92_15220 [Magnetospirillum sp. 64-120]